MTVARGEYVGRRLDVLDGWRAVSIILVLAGHLVPLGPAAWELNEAVSSAGMATFFILSGFLITRFMLARPHVGDFLLRRIARIVPLAWLSMVILALASSASAGEWLANLGFVSNLPPTPLLVGGEHLWSLCVEMQFYLLVAFAVAVGGRRALYALPVLGLLVTSLRVWTGTTVSIITWLRGDEILAGVTLALLWHHRDRLPFPRNLAPTTVAPATAVFLVLLVVSSHPHVDWFNYARPYVALLMIGLTLVSSDSPVHRLLSCRSMRYIASISFALYVVHGMLTVTWLGSGDTVARYLKRPLLLAATWGLAHLSTTYYEVPIIRAAKRLGSPRRPSRVS